MKRPIPPLQETPEALKQLLSAAPGVQTHQRLPALYLLQTQQARPRRQGAHLLGGNRHTVGRWRDTYARGGVAQMLTTAQAPGTPALWSAAMQPGLRERLAPPHGRASYKAIWQWVSQEYGVSSASKTAQKFVRYTLRAKRKGPSKSPIQNS